MGNERNRTAMETKRNPVTSIVLVTPETAQFWLSRAHPNRAVKQRWVNQLTEMILRDEWRTTHQGIALDWEDRPVDGQHRLLAVVKSGVAVEMMVTRGIRFDDSLAAIDGGVGRSFGDHLRMLGEANCNTKAGVTRAVRILTEPEQPWTGTPSKAALKDTLDRNRDTIEMIMFAATRDGGGLRLSVAVLGVAATNALKFRDVSSQFLDGMIKGERLVAGSPTLALRNWVIAKKSLSDGSRGYIHLITKTISALDALNHGEETRTLKAGLNRYQRWCRSVGVPENPSVASFLGKAK